MLDRAHRLSSPAHFRRVTRRGRRSQHGSVLCYVDLQERDNARFGFIVSKSVGNAVTRNLVKRRLRAIAREHFPHIPADIVVRAMPNAGLVSAEQLAADMRLCLERIVEGRS